MADLLLVIVVVGIALFFDFMNGFHDAANSIATVVSTGVLPPKLAVGWAAFFNFVAAFGFGVSVASTIGKGIIDPKIVTPFLLIAVLTGSIAWDVITWYFGLPSSSSHALIGGLVGAGLAAGDSVKWHGIYEKVVIPMVVSPIAGLLLGAVLMLAILWLVRHRAPRKVNRNFRGAQILSSGAMAYGHGLQDAQKTMGIIALALFVSGHLGPNEDIPLW